MNNNHGQGSLEYLLLIAGAVLVAIIVFLLLFSFAPVGEVALNTNIEEFEKIDLCTSQGADCSFFLNWNDGLTSEPYGFVIENTSSWRTLYVTGITVRLLCGDVACTTNPTWGNPFTTLEMPFGGVGSPVCTIKPGTGGAGQPDAIYLCESSCTQSKLSTGPGTCFTTSPIPFCAGATCSQVFPFNLNPSGSFGIFIPPGGTKKMGVGLALPINAQELTGVQYVFHVAQVKSDNTLQNLSDDVKALPLFWYSSSPDYTGSAYFCKYVSGNWSAQYGCTLDPGCELTQCKIHDPNDPSYVGSSEDNPNVHQFCETGISGTPFPGDTIVCADDSLVTKPSCLNVDSGLNPGFFNFTPGPVSPMGQSLSDTTVFQMGVDPFKNVADYVSAVPKGLYVEINQFTPPVGTQCDSSSTPAQCMSACSAVFSSSTIEVVHLPAANINTPQMCDSLSTAVPMSIISPITAVGFYNATSGTRCTGIIQFAPTEMDKLESAALAGKDFYFGLRVKSGSPLSIDSPYTVDGVPTHTVPIIRALFYPK